ncbi:MAG TPA: hypothetical protein VH599_08395 [Ktedonobacterales bacterium]|jgi:hypothetical protein
MSNQETSETGGASSPLLKQGASALAPGEPQMQQGQPRTGWRTYETRGQPVQAHGYEITPIGRVAQIIWPGGGLLWNRPVAVEVRQGAQQTRLPIRNMTRRIIASSLIGLAITSLLLSWTQTKRKPLREKKRRRRKA